MTERTLKTYCRICEAHCGLQVELDEQSKILRIYPDKSHPISQGFVCAKGLKFGAIADHPERLLYPQMRDDNGNLERVSWEKALSHTGKKLKAIIREHGVHAVGIYFGTPMIHNGLGTLTLLQWAKALGTRNVYSAGSQDNANKFVAQSLIHGSQWMMPLVDIEHADFALLIGTNPVVSQGTFVHMPQGTKAYDAFIGRGGEMVIIDPRESESAKRWGGHIPIIPDTDVYLLLALLYELRDLYHQEMPQGLEDLLALAEDYPPEKANSLTGISVETIQTIARKIRTADRATFMLSVGVNQGSFGTLCFVAIQAIAYLTGNFDAKGGLLYNRWAHLLETLVGLKQEASRIGGYIPYAGGMPCGILGDEILTEGEEQIKALIVVSGNPLTSAPDELKLRRAFDSLELMVSIDIFENETAEYADIILPGATWLERFDICAWDAMYESVNFLQSSPPVRGLPGETRTERQIIADLSWQSGTPVLGMTFLARFLADTNWDAILPRWLKPLQWLFRGRLQGSDGVPWFAPEAGVYRGKKSKKLRFWDEDLFGGERQRLIAHADRLKQQSGKLYLLGRRRRLAQNSWIHNAGRTEKAREACAWLSPEDMTKHGLSDGDSIRITSQTASIEIEVYHDASVMPGTIVAPHGLPSVNVNRLISSESLYIEPMSGMHKLSGHPVTIEKSGTISA